MKKMLLTATIAAFMSSCGSQENKNSSNNPFLVEYTTPFQVPPFDQIKLEHYKPAFLAGMEEHIKEIEAIVNNPEPATFENTIAALDAAGIQLRKVSIVFFGLNSANTNDEMQALSRELSPMLSKHSDDISLNPALFVRVKEVYTNKENLNLTKEQAKLLEETYKAFERGGANLSNEKQQILRELNTEISMLQLTFGQNMLKETNDFKLVIDKEEDLAGLPASLVAAAAATATAAGEEGKWIFTLQNPSVMPFLQYAENRELREKIFKGYTERGNHGNENDNKEVVAKLIKARLEKAKLMGYDEYASFILEERMAKTPAAVYELLNQLWKPALKKANEELADINAEIKKDGKTFSAEGWDWRYYAERAKKAKFNLDENQIRPYLKLENVRQGMFNLSTKLWGITFTPLANMPLPHEDAEVFECKDADGTHLGVLYLDWFPRASKRGGAWCSSYRPQTYKNGKKVAPVVTIVCNFSKPAPGEPALLSADEASTMFHEFGHALHGLFRDVNYTGVSGVPRDFVELPSQIMEHWVFEPAVLNDFAKHYETGEVIPTDLIKKLEASGKYGQGFATTEYLAASLLDMDFHVLKEIPENIDVVKFESETLSKRGLLQQIPARYRTTYFNHTMAGGYTAGYYSYIWAEVLDSDAYQAFVETGDIFNKEVAKRFRDYVLTPGGIDDAMDMYVNFRGKKPSIEGLLKGRGLN
ncbi:MAG: M3 family metallopeptidase [Phocaeicola sp.]